jgi:putative hydrolase of HD superfamily
MKNSLDFLIKSNKLKEIPRTGWVLMKVKNSETIAEHMFRVAIAAWFLGKMNNLNVKKLIKIALAHDLVEVYAGDKTPFFYWEGLDKNKKKDAEILMKGVRLSRKEKQKRGDVKFKKEKKSIIDLLSCLRPDLKNEIFSAWLDYEKRTSKEGRFVKQIDKIEALLQSIEYFGSNKIKSGTSWWEGTEEVVEDPLLLDFLKTIQHKFYKGTDSSYKKNKELENILNFLSEVGKLKRMPRLYWKMRGLKNPETVASHISALSLMVWIFGKEKKQLKMEKLLKMALCHEITAVYTHDTTPYDWGFLKIKKGKKETLERIPFLSAKEKTKQFKNDFKKEGAAILKLVRRLEPSLKNEIIQLWKEYRNRESPEARFLGQLNVLAILLQAILYKKQKNNFSINALWELVFEICDDPTALSLIDEMKKEL